MYLEGKFHMKACINKKRSQILWFIGLWLASLLVFLGTTWVLKLIMKTLA